MTGIPWCYCIIVNCFRCDKRIMKKEGVSLYLLATYTELFTDEVIRYLGLAAKKFRVEGCRWNQIATIEAGWWVFGGSLHYSHFFSISWKFSIIKNHTHKKRETEEKDDGRKRRKGKQVSQAKGTRENKRMERGQWKGRKTEREWEKQKQRDLCTWWRCHEHLSSPPRYAGYAALMDKAWKSSKSPKACPGKDSDGAELGCASSAAPRSPHSTSLSAHAAFGEDGRTRLSLPRWMTVLGGSNSWVCLAQMGPMDKAVSLTTGHQQVQKTERRNTRRKSDTEFKLQWKWVQIKTHNISIIKKLSKESTLDYPSKGEQEKFIQTSFMPSPGIRFCFVLILHWSMSAWGLLSKHHNK